MVLSVKVYNEEGEQISTCTATCATNKGGKVGVYVDDMSDVVWYDLKYECLEPGEQFITVYKLDMLLKYVNTC